MVETGMIFPVLPGKREAMLAFAQNLMGERKAEYEQSQVGVRKESWFLQPTPLGDLCVVHFESESPESVFAGLAESEEPFDVWFRDQVREITGLDLTLPLPDLPPRIFHWARP